jgi:hypothetical protein
MSTPTTIIEVQPPPIIVVESVAGEFIGPQGPPGPEGPPGTGGSALSGTAVLSVPAPAGRLEWAQTFAAVGVLPTSRIVLSLAGEADSAENDPELLDVLSLWGTPATGEITIGATFGAQVSGPVTVNWSAF